jgi:hypothetical protein
MGKLPIICGGERVGEADAARERLYTCLDVRAPLRRGVWRAWAVGDAGEVLIGALEPVNGRGAISRRFSRQALSKAGELSRVELRPAETMEARPETATGAKARPGIAAERPAETAEARPQSATGAGIAAARPAQDTQAAARPARDTETRPQAADAWRRPGQGQRLFRCARFQRQLRGVRDALTRSDGERRRVALVREEDAPFPLPELFCLASAARIGKKDYWIFSFDRQGWPVL